MRCYSEGEETVIGSHDPPAKPGARRFIVERSSAQISPHMQWNGFEDNFDCTLPIAHQYTVFLIGISGYYDSLLHRMRQVLSAWPLAEPERKTLEGILHDTKITRYKLTVGSDDWRERADPQYGNNVGSCCAEDIFKQRPLSQFLSEALEKDISHSGSASGSKRIAPRDTEKGQSTEENLERKIEIGQDRCGQVEERKEPRWYHVRYCVGNWAPLLLSAIGIKKCLLPMPIDDLIEDIRKGNLLKGPQWQFPGAAIKSIETPNDLTVLDRPSTSPIVLSLPYLFVLSIRELIRKECADLQLAVGKVSVHSKKGKWC